MEANPSKDPASQQMLAFRLGGEEYGLSILAVRELRAYEHVTRIANAPACVKGMLNLRGFVVPIVDLRIWLALPDPRYDATTVVVVVNVDGNTVGMVVDSVTDVVDLPYESRRPTPDLGAAASAPYLSGIGMLEERLLILVDAERLLSSIDLGPHQGLAA